MMLTRTTHRHIREEQPGLVKILPSKGNKIGGVLTFCNDLVTDLRIDHSLCQSQPLSILSKIDNKHFMDKRKYLLDRRKVLELVNVVIHFMSEIC